MATKTKIAKGTRAKLKANVAYLDMLDGHTALAGSVVVVDSVNGTGGAAVSQTVLERAKQTHRFFTRVENLEVVA